MTILEPTLRTHYPPGEKYSAWGTDYTNAWQHRSWAGQIAAHPREEDRKEWAMATNGADLFQSIMGCVEDAAFVRFFIHNPTGRCLAIWGLSRRGFAWMICHRDAPGHKHAIHRYWKPAIKEFHRERKVVQAWAWSGNALHIAWLDRFGFKTSGLELGEFVHFTRRDTA